MRLEHFKKQRLADANIADRNYRARPAFHANACLANRLMDRTGRKIVADVGSGGKRSRVEVENLLVHHEILDLAKMCGGMNRVE